MADITSIVAIRNDSGAHIYLNNLEGFQGIDVVAHQEKVTGGMWIPWCDNADAFYNGIVFPIVQGPHHMRLQNLDISGGDGFLISIFQSGASVRYVTAEEYVDNAPPVPGVSKINGDRILHIKSIDEYHLEFEFLG